MKSKVVQRRSTVLIIDNNEDTIKSTDLGTLYHRFMQIYDFNPNIFSHFSFNYYSKILDQSPLLKIFKK